MTVPGVITRMTSRVTKPTASFGSCVCSQIATLKPRDTSLGIYAAAA